MGSGRVPIEVSGFWILRRPDRIHVGRRTIQAAKNAIRVRLTLGCAALIATLRAGEQFLLKTGTREWFSSNNMVCRC